MATRVRKRDGVTIQAFDRMKIEHAIRKAWLAAGSELTYERKIGDVADGVVRRLPNSNSIADVELIQDAVELQLMHDGFHEVAKAYILFRQKRSELRTRRLHPDPDALANYIHPAKYARYIPTLGRRELYHETVARVEDMHIRRFPVLETEIRQAFDLVREKRILPSMRSLADDTPLPTPEGWKCVGDVVVGDFLFDRDGNQTRVIAVQKFDAIPLFDVHFSDGATLCASADHLWVTSTLDDRIVGRERTVTTRQIYQTLSQRSGDARKYNHAIWNAAPLMLPDTDLPLDPYILGLWLGDGFSHSGQFACHRRDAEIPAAYATAGFPVTAPGPGNPYAWGTHKLATVLRSMGLRDNKHIPLVYLRGAEGQRLALLQGLMDSDGHTTPEGRSCFSNTSKAILAGVAELLSSLGIKFTTTGPNRKEPHHKDGYEYRFFTKLPVHRLQRKRGRLREDHRESNAYRTIVSVTPAGQGAATCFHVESPTHTYLAGQRMIVTHNSMQFAGAAVEAAHARQFNCCASLIDRPRVFGEILYLLLCGCGVGYSVQFEHVNRLPALGYVIEDSPVVHHNIGDSSEGWADALNVLVDSYIRGYYVEFGYSRIRPKNAPLKTSGGRAPGHLPLKKTLEDVRGILDEAQGRRLRPIECHDILCHAASAVLSGGIRRSAMIAIFSLEDSEMIYAKTGKWYRKTPWRAYANNSVAIFPDTKRQQFDRVIELSREWGEPGFVYLASPDHARNPCQPGWATLLTPTGITTLSNIRIGDTVWSGRRWTKVVNKVATGVKSVFGYRTRAGTFYGTSQHRIVCDGEKIEADDASGIDAVRLHPDYVAPLSAVDPQDVLDGLLLGDGMLHKASNNLPLLCIGVEDEEPYSNGEVAHLIGPFRPGISPYAWEVRTTLETTDLVPTYDRRVPDRFRFGSPGKVRGFLRGLYSANGSIVHNRVTLKATSFQVIEAVQEMLSSLGIPAYYTVNTSHATQFANGVYTCRESYDLNIAHQHGRKLFAVQIGFLHLKKTTRLASTLTTGSDRPPKSTYDIVEKVYIGDESVYDITVDAEEHTYWTGGLLVSNCAEAGLNPVLVVDEDVLQILAQRRVGGKRVPNVTPALGERFTGFSFCNLCEINAAMFKSKGDFARAAKAAALIGTLQAAYTNLPYLGWVSEVIAEREALLGVGMTGIMDAPEIALDPSCQREIASAIVGWNRQYAEKIGIRPAARCTVVKPSGTASLELGGVASGHHPHHAKRYIRRVVATELEPVFQHFRTVNPHMCVRKPDGAWVVEFPVAAPTGAIVRDDVTAIEFLEMVRRTQENWIVPGTARPESSSGLYHSVSNTCTVRPAEWDAVKDYIWAHRESLVNVSLLAHSGDKDYSFAPHEAIVTEADEARWNQLLASYRPVDYSQMQEAEDGTDLRGEAACAGGSCSIV